ncbi:MAG TPA: M28 family metallopeptidase [Casimicrobiaceae bacterium]|nr:M28 family metallopeptidase [Casimicrobiaceae bacterium]
MQLVREISRERLESHVRTLAGFGTRHTLSATDDPKRGIGAARRWIRDTLQRCGSEGGGRLTVEFDAFDQAPTPRVPEPTTIVNVVATLEGSDAGEKPRTLVVSGHYDSMCSNVMNRTCDAPGANDDASGTAVVIELACTMAKRRFPATLVFMAVAGEEQGLLGAAHWARRARERNLDVEAMITNDIVGNAHDESGRRDASYIRLFAQGVPATKELSEEWQRRLETGGENDSPSRALARAIREAAALYVPDLAVRIVYRRDRYLRGGDHIPFLAQGYAAVRFTEAREDYRRQHQDVRIVDGVQYGDLPEFVDYGYLANVARVNAAALATLARAPAAPSGVRIETLRLENATTLSWLANAQANLAGYEIVWRETTVPLWQGSQFVGNVTRATVPLSKDDYLFSVRAVSNDGHRSAATYPMTLRSPVPPPAM